MNSKDPMLQNDEAALELFRRFSKMADGFSTKDAVTAAGEVMVNAIRQAYPTRQGAELAWNEWAARLKGQLMNCYLGNGRLKGVFPYTQHLVLEGTLDLTERKKR